MTDDFEITWIGCDKSNDGVTAVGYGDRIFDRSVDQIPFDEAIVIHGFDVIDSDVLADTLHGNDVESRTVNMERMSGVERYACVT